MERREGPGSLRFRTSPSSRATLSDPGRPSWTSPLAVPSISGSGKGTPSPSASGSFEAELLKQGATPGCDACLRPTTVPVYASSRSFGCVSFRRSRCLSFRPAKLGLGWLVRPSRSVLSFRTLFILAHAFMSDWRDFHPRRCSTSPVTHHAEGMPDPSRSIGRKPDLRTTQEKELDPDGVALRPQATLHEHGLEWDKRFRS